MKIAIASEGQDTSSQVAGVFGRCAFFLFVDTESGAVEARSNPGDGASGGAGVEAARFVAGQGVQVVIAPRLGPKAEAVLEGAGIRLHAQTGCTAAEALDDLRRKESE